MLDYSFIRQIRLAMAVTYLAGLFLHVPQLMSIAFLVWAVTYLYTYAIMESSFFKMLEKAKAEKKDGEEENKDQEN